MPQLVRRDEENVSHHFVFALGPVIADASLIAPQ
jgi:hypothetical protein